MTHDKPVVWFHCASLGEFEQGRPIIEGYRLKQPEHKIVVTFFSPSGYEAKKGDPIAEWIFYLPLDTCQNVRRFLDAVQPAKAIFIKYEFWYNYLTALKRRQIPTYVVSATFRQSQPFFKWYGAIFRRMLSAFTLTFVQNQSSKELLNKISFTQAVVTGDTRFDRVWVQAQRPCSLPIVEAFLNTSPQDVIVAGSTWPKDEELLFKLLYEHKQLKIILVPHEIDQRRITAVMEQFALFSPVQYTQLSGPEMVNHDSRVMVVDTIGMLSSLYRFGSIAYIGGGFDDGIHNILEAAVYGIPVIFGPNYQKFNEACDLLKTGGAFSVKTCLQLKAQIKTFLTIPHLRMKGGEACINYVRTHLGAAKIVLEHI